NEPVSDRASGNSIQSGAAPTPLTYRTRLAATGGVGAFLTAAGPRGARVSTWLDLAYTVTVRGTGDGTLDLSGVVGGAGGINVNLAGGGWLSLSGSNTFTGGVTLN